MDGNDLFLDAGSRTAIAGTDATTLRRGQTTVDAAAVTAGDMTLAEALTRTGTLALHATGAITQTGTAVITTPRLTVAGATAGPGAVVTRSDLVSAGTAAIEALGGAVNLTARSLSTGAPIVSGTSPTPAGSVTLTATGAGALGDVTQAAGTAGRWWWAAG